MHSKMTAAKQATDYANTFDFSWS